MPGYLSSHQRYPCLNPWWLAPPFDEDSVLRLFEIQQSGEVFFSETNSAQRRRICQTEFAGNLLLELHQGWYLCGLRISGNQHGTKISNYTHTQSSRISSQKYFFNYRSLHKPRDHGKLIANPFELSMQKFTIHDLFMYFNQPHSATPLRN